MRVETTSWDCELDRKRPQVHATSGKFSCVHVWLKWTKSPRMHFLQSISITRCKSMQLYRMQTWVAVEGSEYMQVICRTSLTASRFICNLAEFSTSAWVVSDCTDGWWQVLPPVQAQCLFQLKNFQVAAHWETWEDAVKLSYSTLVAMITRKLNCWDLCCKDCTIHANILAELYREPKPFL